MSITCQVFVHPCHWLPTSALLDEVFMAQTRAKTVDQEREEVYAALQYAASFHCLVEEWKDCEELEPQPKERWASVEKRKQGIKRNGVHVAASIDA